MPPISSFFRPPPWSRANKGQTPEPKPCPPTQQSSSPPTFIDITSDADDDSGPGPDSDSDPEAQLDPDLSQSVAKNESTSVVPTSSYEPPRKPSPAPVSFAVVVPSPARAASAVPSAPEQAFPHLPENTNVVSSFGSTTSQRIVKNGKEVVISSDGEDTDSLASLEDPDILFAPTAKQNNKNDPTKSKKTTGADKALVAQLSKPKKYRNTIDSLVNDALDDDQIEENVAKVKAAFARVQASEKTVPGHEKTRNALHEDMLASAFGVNEDEIGFKRLLDAVRRTEALDSDRVWHFLDRTQMTPAPLEFPTELFPPGSNMAALRGWFSLAHDLNTFQLSLYSRT